MPSLPMWQPARRLTTAGMSKNHAPFAGNTRIIPHPPVGFKRETRFLEVSAPQSMPISHIRSLRTYPRLGGTPRPTAPPRQRMRFRPHHNLISHKTCSLDLETNQKSRSNGLTKQQRIHSPLQMDATISHNIEAIRR